MKDLILQLLSKHPEGLTITSIAESLGIHRHTATKYVKELILSGEVKERNVGMAKLCFLSRYAAKHSKAEAGQAQLFILALILLAIPVLIIAQNFENSTTGSFADVIDTTFIPPSSDTMQTTTVSTTVEQSTHPSAPEQPELAENATEESTVNNQILDNATQENSVDDALTANASSQTALNETFDQAADNATESNENAIGEVLPSEKSNSSLTEEIGIRLDVPQKVSRGEEFAARATVTNKFSSDKSIRLKWQLPAGFAIIEGDEQKACVLKPEEQCVSEVKIKAESELGVHQIKVKASYD